MSVQFTTDSLPRPTETATSFPPPTVNPTVHTTNAPSNSSLAMQRGWTPSPYPTSAHQFAAFAAQHGLNGTPPPPPHHAFLHPSTHHPASPIPFGSGVPGLPLTGMMPVLPMAVMPMPMGPTAMSPAPHGHVTQPQPSYVRAQAQQHVHTYTAAPPPPAKPKAPSTRGRSNDRVSSWRKAVPKQDGELDHERKSVAREHKTSRDDERKHSVKVSTKPEAKELSRKKSTRSIQRDGSSTTRRPPSPIVSSNPEEPLHEVTNVDALASWGARRAEAMREALAEYDSLNTRSRSSDERADSGGVRVRHKTVGTNSGSARPRVLRTDSVDVVCGVPEHPVRCRCLRRSDAFDGHPDLGEWPEKHQVAGIQRGYTAPDQRERDHGYGERGVGYDLRDRGFQNEPNEAPYPYHPQLMRRRSRGRLATFLFGERRPTLSRAMSTPHLRAQAGYEFMPQATGLRVQPGYEPGAMMAEGTERGYQTLRGMPSNGDLRRQPSGMSLRHEY